MADRAGSPAFQVLPECAAAVAVIEAAMGDRSSVSISYTSFRMDHHFGRQTLSPSLKQLDHLGLIDIAPGPRLVNVFRLSNRWRVIGVVEAARLSELAREVKPHRTFGKHRRWRSRSSQQSRWRRWRRWSESHTPRPVTLPTLVVHG